ncbi:cancer-associated gene 1 protein isoform X1 [Dasypus novemcinctus]|uniref:cancer-associated gene 1 protein isoform X1 n=1 Tax=Dasypus novemcinctus TaxID=9361 RepID=UPI00265FB6B9|nr:cancer-associated gene 1 protein isoform X1 [Dasypus novemcinctus]
MSLEHEDFHHSAFRNKNYQTFWPSPSDAVQFDVDTSHEKLESLSEADAMDISNHSQDLSPSDSPFCMETSGTTSDLPQNEIKNVKGENKSQFTLSEDIYNALDNLIGDVNIENYSQTVLSQPFDTSISTLRQFQPLCKFHWTEAFNDETTTFQNPREGLSYTKKPELQTHVFNYAKDNNIKTDLFNEESPVEISISTNKDLLDHESASQPSRSPPLIDCIEETLKLREKSLAKNTAKGSALHHTQPQSFSYTESILTDVEGPLYKENSFNLLDLRANKIEEIAVSSKEKENSGEIREMSFTHQKEIKVEGMESPELFSAWSPVDISWNGVASRESCRTPHTEQSFESLQPLEEDMALNEVLRKLKYTNKKQQTRIQDLQCSNMYLEKKVKELQVKITKQQVFVNIINKLKGNVEELIEDKYKVILEKSDSDRSLKNLQEILSDTQKHLQESKKEKETLQLELKKAKLNYIRLQERYVTEIQQKNKSVNQCIEMDKTLSKKEAEVEKLQQLKGELEKATASALDLLKREKETRGKELLSLQEEFQKREKENLDERQKLKSSLGKLVAQVKNLQFISENERAKNTKLQQQINEMKNEHAKFQQQAARSEEQNYVPKFEIAQSKEQPEGEIKSDITQDAKVIHSCLFLNCPPCEEESLNPSDAKKTQLASKIHNLLALVVGLLTCPDGANPDAEHFKESEKVSDIMLQKWKSFHLKKKILDKELLNHKARITTFRKLIANEKAFQDQVIEVTDFDPNEAKNVKDVPILLGAKLDKYHNLNEELDFLIGKLGNLLESKEDHCNRLIEENDKYQRHLGNLINKVSSYEEIIECADQRLEIFHSHIAHLEERNKHLEDLVKRPKERTRRLRPRRLENHPKSLTVLVTNPQKMKHNKLFSFVALLN